MFNGEGASSTALNGRGAAGTNAADPLHFLLKKLSPDATISLGIVRTEAAGLTSEEVNRIVMMVEQRWNRESITTAARRITPWVMVQNYIKQTKQAKSLG